MILIREATHSDEKWIISTINKLIQLSSPMSGISNTEKYFIAEARGRKKRIGTVGIDISRGEIKHLVVIPLERRKYVGSKLIQHAIKKLIHFKPPTIWAQVRTNNLPSIKCFEKNGFVIVKTVSSSYNEKIKLFRMELSSYKRRGE
jgi:ribosomal protein S18 acetylase RimI-like enzyme